MNYLVEELSMIFEKTRRSRSSITFVGTLEDSKKAIFNLIPTESSPEKGLKFQVYINRLSDYLGIDADKIITYLPKNREEWEYQKSESIEWSGYAGFFKNQSEVKILLNGLKKS